MTLSIAPIGPTIVAQAATLGVALQPGTVVTAQVLKLLDANLVRIAIANLTLDVATTLPLQLGQTLQLAIRQTKNGISLAQIVPQQVVPGQVLDEAQIVLRGSAVIIDDIPLASNVQPSAAKPVLTPLEARAVAVAAQTAATQQRGLSFLFANLTSAVASGSLPQTALAAATQLLTMRQPDNRVLTGADIKTALQSSGLVMEATLATTPASQPIVLLDLKAALTVLRQALATWIGPDAATGHSSSPKPLALPVKLTVAAPLSAPSEQLSSSPIDTPLPEKTIKALSGQPAIVVVPAGGEPGSAKSAIPHVSGAVVPDDAEAFSVPPDESVVPRPGPMRVSALPADATSARHEIPPPFRDALPSAQSVAASSLAPDAEPAAIAQQLIADTDGALARQTLLQIASLPDHTAGPRNEALQPRWNFEIPFVTPQGTAMAQFAISRDGAGNETDPAQRIWRARFSLDVEPAGPVHALISFNGDKTFVKMWAERPETAARLRANATQLGVSLGHAELKAGDIVVADGAPTRTQTPMSGHFLNRAS